MNIIQQAKLSQYTTFQLGGACLGLISCQTPGELEDAVRYFVKEDLPFILIGEGSNLVVSDDGVACFVIRYVSDKPLINRTDTSLTVAGSTRLDDLVLYAAEHGLEGLNYASGIPGTVGGAVVGNAGAFGRQVGDVITSVSLITKTGERKTAFPEELQFAYRTSALKTTGDIVSQVELRVSPGDKTALLEERRTILATRKAKHPNLKEFPCAGSFFRNIEPTSQAGRRQAAGWFLDQAGARNLKAGRASVFEKHANIIVNSGNCTANDVYSLSQQMAALVKDKFDLDLIREVRFVGVFSDAKSSSSAFIW